MAVLDSFSLFVRGFATLCGLFSDSLWSFSFVFVVVWCLCGLVLHVFFII